MWIIFTSSLEAKPTANYRIVDYNPQDALGTGIEKVTFEKGEVDSAQYFPGCCWRRQNQLARLKGMLWTPKAEFPKEISAD